MRYLLDTNIVSDLVRNPQGRAAQHISEVGEAQVCTSIIVTAELPYGAAKKRSPRLAAQLEAVLGALDVLPFEAPADTAYGLLRTRLDRLGSQSAATICSSPLRPQCSAIPSSPTTSGSLPGSTTSLARIGCAKPAWIAHAAERSCASPALRYRGALRR